VTVPVAAAGETVAVKVTVCPEIDGLGFDVSDVVVLVLAPLFTVCVSTGELPPL
jgi:hypothetical protein